MVDLVDDIAYSPDVVARGPGGAATPARRSSATRRWSPPASPAAGCPPDNEVVCTLDDPRMPGAGRSELGTTRTAAALELWRDRLDGAVVAIGNAPDRAVPPAGAGRGRRAAPGRGARHPGRLHRRGRVQGGAGRASDLEYLVVRGRRGGSAITAAAVNAIASERASDGGRTAVRGRARPRRPGAGDGQGRPADRRGRRRRLPQRRGTAAASPASIAAPYLRDGQVEEPLVYPVTTETTDHPGGYQGAIDDFYDAAAARLAAHLDAGRDVVVLAEGDPFFYGSYMHMHKRLARPVTRPRSCPA